ncbi:MAG TPA: hypothetical protein VFU45_08110 [Gemmatimonadales bacterium]|nr:hypothetical protein [Gemmatimonadales bacterium]
MRRPNLVLISAGICVVAIGGCSADAVSPPSLGSVVLVSGDAQTSSPGQALPDTLVARILSVTGRPMSGVEVSWRVTYGAGTLTPGPDTSDANGNIRATLTLGPAPGTTQVVATVADLPGVTFTATGRGLQATSLAVGLVTACAIDITAHTWCWGGTASSGDSGAATAPYYVPRLVAGGHHFTELAAGEEHMCGLDQSGTTWCWGWDYYQALGTGATGHVDYPVMLASAPTFAHIFGGDAEHTCGLTADGTAYCWGRDDLGQLGSGSTTTSVGTPVAVAGGIKFSSLSPTIDRTCGVAIGGAAYCWGNNNGVLLGDSGASGAASNVPVPVAGNHTFLALATTDTYTCGVTSDVGRVCWGAVPDGGAQRGVPVPAPQLSDLSEYLPAYNGGFGILAKEAISLVGFSSPRNEGAPIPLHGLTAGFWTACALAQDATVYCWGVNDAGQAGNPDAYPYDGGWSAAHAVVVPATY